MYQVSEGLDKVISGSGRTFRARLNGISDGIQEIVQTNFSTPDSYFYVGGATASKIEVSMFTNFFFQAEDGIRDRNVTGVQTCALPISSFVFFPSSETNPFSLNHRNERLMVA